MTMRLAEVGQTHLLTASQTEVPNEIGAEIAALKAEINQLKAQISTGQVQGSSDSQNNPLTREVRERPKAVAPKNDRLIKI